MCLVLWRQKGAKDTWNWIFPHRTNCLPFSLHSKIDFQTRHPQNHPPPPYQETYLSFVSAKLNFDHLLSIWVSRENLTLRRCPGVSDVFESVVNAERNWIGALSRMGVNSSSRNDTSLLSDEDGKWSNNPLTLIPIFSSPISYIMSPNTSSWWCQWKDLLRNCRFS